MKESGRDSVTNDWYEPSGDGKHQETYNNAVLESNNIHLYVSLVLASDFFHATVWMLLAIGIIGNILVVVWRFTQKRDQRSSPLSILIIMLAVSDFFYCVHLLLLESLVTESHLRPQRHYFWQKMSFACITSSVLSWFFCPTAQWAIFNIAVYSFQAMSEFCSRCCCCSLVRKRNLVIIIIFQVSFSVASMFPMIIVRYTIDYPILFPSYEYDRSNYSWINLTRSAQITEIFGRCALVQSCGFGICINSTRFSVSHLSHTTAINESTFCGTSTNLDSENVLGAAVASLCTVLTLLSVVLYLMAWQCLTVDRARISEILEFQWRLRVIVFLNTLCWIVSTAFHWTGIFGVSPNGSSNARLVNNFTAANVLLISTRPAVNPLIYTLTGKNFCKRIKCDISVGRSNSNYHGDRTLGVERFSCIPCAKCVHRYEDNDPDEQSSLMTSINDSSEIA